MREEANDCGPRVLANNPLIFFKQTIHFLKELSVKDRDLKDWEKNIKVMFEKFPGMKKVISKPVYYLNAPWVRGVNEYFMENAKGSASENFYRIVFQQGSPKILMKIGSGELAGLETTCVVDKGRIVGVAGLERVDVSVKSNFLPMLLMMGMFGAIQNHINYISNVCADIRTRQIVGDHARLERISEVILDCFESIPEMDQDMMRLNLARMVSNTDECLELLIVMREELNRESQAKNFWLFTFDRVPKEVMDSNYNKSFYDPIDFLRQLLQHNVFSAYERFVAGKICQIVLSGNYSPSNIERSKKSVVRMKESIGKIFDDRIDAHKRGVDEYRRLIRECENGCDVGGWSISRADSNLKCNT